MAVHKFMSIKEGGYFYRFYPKLRPITDNEDTLVRSTLFDLPIIQQTKKDHFSFLYGKFIGKHNKKEPIIELEQDGKLLLFDSHTEALEERGLTSTLIIRVTEDIYNYPFKTDHIYSITPDEVTELITPQ